MKYFKRNNLLFSLCGLNCGLCPMNLGGYCPGCGGGAGNQSCAIARCSMQHENVEYCFECSEYPCEKYENIDEFDSFITHRNQKSDMFKFKTVGSEAYSSEQQKKQSQLRHLLENYNDGRKKTLFCLAANLLGSDDLESIISELDRLDPTLTLKDRSAHASALLLKAAEKQNIVLKLRKKTETPL